MILINVQYLEKLVLVSKKVRTVKAPPPNKKFLPSGADFPTPKRCLENPLFNDDEKLETKKLLLTAVWFSVSTGICGLSTTDEESKKKKKKKKIVIKKFVAS